MKKFWKWMRRWGWFIMAGVGAVAGAAIAVILRQPPPTKKLEQEFKAIEAAKKADELAVEAGHERAVAALEVEHERVIAEFDDKQKAKAEKLKQDPEALARYLVRMGKM